MFTRAFIACALAFALACATTSGQAATLVGSTIDPTGINDLVVDGTTYNVTFSFTPGASPFTPGTPLSLDAANILATALTSLSVNGLANNSSPADGFLVMVDGSTSGEGVALSTFSPVLWSSFSGGSSLVFGSQIFCFGGQFPVCEGNVVEAANFTATPLPAALPLFAGGLGALGLLGWRRKRKAAAALAA